MCFMKIPLVTGALAGLLAAASTFASDLYVFPSKGQSDAQMDKDKYSCHQWSVRESGYDPLNPPGSSGTAAAPAYNPGRNILGGAAKGAIIGGIAGDAGKGAAAGAIGGGVFGGVRHQRKVDAARQQQAASNDALRNGYRRAYSACLEGKGYTVR